MHRISAERLASTVFQPQLFGKWQENLTEMATTFSQAEPYPHLVIDNFFADSTAAEMVENFPSNDWDGWFSYYNPIEIKKACDDLTLLHPAIQEIFYQLNTPEFVRMIQELTGIPNLEYDPHLHGGGLHSIPRNGKLNLHLDYSLHPLSGKERRINIIIYLNEHWQEAWNGNLELWGADLKECQKKVVPLFNRAAIFQTFDESWHGHPHRLECPPDQARKSLAIYYVSEPREGASFRKKAHFIQTPGEVQDSRIQALLDIRDVRRIEKTDIAEIFPDWEDVCFSDCSRD